MSSSNECSCNTVRPPIRERSGTSFTELKHLIIAVCLLNMWTYMPRPSTKRGSPRNCFSPFPDIGGKYIKKLQLIHHEDWTYSTRLQSARLSLTRLHVTQEESRSKTLMLCYYTASYEFLSWKWDLVISSYVILWTLILTVNCYFPLKHTALILSASGKNCWPT